MNILGISAYHHDSAAALIQNGKVISCAQEERFTHIKHDASFPKNAIQHCLNEGKISLEDINIVVFYDKPLLTFHRLLETYLLSSHRGISSFIKSISTWIKEKYFLKKILKQELANIGKNNFTQQILFTQHHQSHAAAAFFPSPFTDAAVLCLDGVSEWATTSLWVGKDNQLHHKWEIKFPNSLGLLYSAFTHFCGFTVNSGEYKLMGLAPYGEPKYADLILKHLIHVKDNGKYRLNMRYFKLKHGVVETNKRFEKLFQRPPREPDSEITQQDMDIARSIQFVTEDIVMKLAKAIKQDYQIDNLCLAGGVALNCIANGSIWKEKLFKGLWVQPAAGDVGGALGAALSVWFEHLKNPRLPHSFEDVNFTKS